MMKSVRGGSASGMAAAAALLMLLILVVVPSSEAVISCSDVVKDLTPCLKYLVSGSGKPPANCCNGASKLAAAASSTADRKAACGCIKSTAKTLNPNAAAAQALPGNCGITLPFTVSPNTDCSKIS